MVGRAEMPRSFSPVFFLWWCVWVWGDGRGIGDDVMLWCGFVVVYSSVLVGG